MAMKDLPGVPVRRAREPKARKTNGKTNGHVAAETIRKGHESEPAPPSRASMGARPLSADRAPLTEWDRLSTASRNEIEHLVEVLKAVKQGDFTARVGGQKEGI